MVLSSAVTAAMSFFRTVNQGGGFKYSNFRCGWDHDLVSHYKRRSFILEVTNALTIAEHFVIRGLSLFGVKNSKLEIDRSLPENTKRQVYIIQVSKYKIVDARYMFV